MNPTATAVHRSATANPTSSVILPSSSPSPSKRFRQLLALPVRLAAIPVRLVAATALDSLELLVCKVSGQQRRARASQFLRADWEPQTKEVSAVTVPVVQGSLPKELDGAFIRVGPNPTGTPISPGHLFDGDGACAVFRIENGNPSFSWSMVHTEKLMAEKGRPRVIHMGSMKGFFGLFHLLLCSVRQALGLVNYNKSTANTALVLHAQRLLVLQEANMPYALRILCDGAMETIGQVLFDSDYVGPFTAHPKLHPTNGCMYSLSYRLGGKDAKHPISMQVVNSSSTLIRNFPITGCNRPVMMHDMALTASFAVVMDLPLVFKPDRMVKENTLPFVFDGSLPARFGLVPVDATDCSEMLWFQFDTGFYVFHTACAYDEGSKVVVWACTMNDFDLSLDESSFNERPKGNTFFSKLVFDRNTGTATREDFEIPAFGVVSLYDFPQVHPKYVTTGAQYCYLLGYDQSKEDKMCSIGAAVGVVKFDMKEGRECGRIRFSDYAVNPATSVHGGECIFIPRADASLEDDGYLATIVYDYTKGKSALHVYDATSMSSEPVAVVDAPLRVPSGFHATFVPLADLKKLRSTA